MAVRIRLKKMGKKHRACYRICVMDSRSPRDGKVIEEVGTYQPHLRNEREVLTLKTERVNYWVGVGAKPTESVEALINKFKDMAAEIRLNPAKNRAILPINATGRRDPRVKMVEPTPDQVATPEGEAPADTAAEAPADAPAAETPAADAPAAE